MGLVPVGARAQTLDGRALAKRMEAELTAEVAQLTARYGRPPGLSVALVGNDEASRVYVQRKHEACKRVGIASNLVILDASTSQTHLTGLIAGMNRDALVDGILVQLPLPAAMEKGAVLRAISPAKDVDAFHPESVGHSLIGDGGMVPCTPQGILLLLDAAGITLAGAEVVVVNHSNLIGKPLAAMLINRDATVTVCHRQTRDLKAHTRRADVVISATGVPGLITSEHVRDGAVVVDVGIHRNPDGTLSGDVAPSVWGKASWVTPVPGGVGPMTIAVLLQNTVRAYKRHVGAK